MNAVRLELLKIVYRAGVEPRHAIEACEQMLPFVMDESPDPQIAQMQEKIDWLTRELDEARKTIIQMNEKLPLAAKSKPKTEPKPEPASDDLQAL